jgi:hypothetical protein
VGLIALAIFAVAIIAPAVAPNFATGSLKWVSLLVPLTLLLYFPAA